MSTPRLRTINTAARELKKIDPDTAVSAAAIRRLVKQGVYRAYIAETVRT